MGKGELIALVAAGIIRFINLNFQCLSFPLYILESVWFSEYFKTALSFKMFHTFCICFPVPTIGDLQLTPSPPPIFSLSLNKSCMDLFAGSSDVNCYSPLCPTFEHKTILLLLRPALKLQPLQMSKQHQSCTSGKYQPNRE